MAKQETAEQAKLRREADAARKRKSRKEGKTAKRAAALQAEINAAKTAEEFWAINLKAANPEKLAGWRERQEQVFDQLWFIFQHVKNNYDASPESDATLPEDKQEYLSVEEGDAALKSDIAAHGKVDTNAIIRLGKYWLNANRITSRFGSEDPESIFAKFGIVIAVPVHYVEDWNDFVREHHYQQAEKAQKALPPPQVPAEVFKEDCLLDDWGRVKDQYL